MNKKKGKKVWDYPDEVPLHRSYGVRRKVYPWVERFKLYVTRALLIFVFGFPLSCAGFVFLMFMLFVPGVLVRFLVGGSLVLLLVIWLTRTLRKRLIFLCKLRLFCKKHGASLRTEQSFLRSLRCSPDRDNFVLKTKECIYYVRYLTARTYRTTLFLEKEDELRLVKFPLNNIVSFVFDWKPKGKKYALKFDVPLTIDDTPVKKVLLLNPVCEEIKYRLERGGYEVTGSGGAHFGFTVYTGSGFLNALERDHT